MERTIILNDADKEVRRFSIQDIQAAFLRNIVFAEFNAAEDGNNGHAETIYYEPGERCQIIAGDRSYENYIGSIASAIERVPIDAPPINDYAVVHDVAAHNVIRREAWETMLPEQQKEARTIWCEI